MNPRIVILGIVGALVIGLFAGRLLWTPSPSSLTTKEVREAVRPEAEPAAKPARPGPGTVQAAPLPPGYETECVCDTGRTRRGLESARTCLEVCRADGGMRQFRVWIPK